MRRALARVRSIVRLRTRARSALGAVTGRKGSISSPASLEPRIAPLDMEALRERGFSSQFGQDVLLDALLRGVGVEQGVFVDVGAHDGVSGSNTLFFERQQGWSGICIEPLPAPYARLQANRSARCFNCAVGETAHIQAFVAIEGYSEMLSGLVSNYDPRHLQRIDTELAEFGGSKEVISVPVRRLDDILDECGIRHVDLMSIDVEGGELAVLRSLDFARVSVFALAIENCYGDDEVTRYLAEHTGLRRVLRIGVDDIYLDLPALRARLAGET